MEQAEMEHIKRLRTWLANGQKCETCKGNGKVLGHRPTIYCTDSAEEIKDSFRLASRTCPDCPDFSWALATIEAQAARITELEAIHKCPYCGGRDDLPPGHIERCYCLPAIRARDRDIKRMSREVAAFKSDAAMYKSNWTEEIKLRQAAQKMIDDLQGELASFRLAGIPARQHSDEAWRKRTEKQAEIIAKLRSRHEDEMVAHRWFAKHFGETMNGRDFSVKCPMATAVLVEWAGEIKMLRGWLHKISLIGLGETWYCGSGSPSPLGAGHDCLVLAQRQEGMIKNLRRLVERYLGYHDGQIHSDSAGECDSCQCSVCMDSRAALARKGNPE